MIRGSLAAACSMCTGWSRCPPPVSGDTAHTQTTMTLRDGPSGCPFWLPFVLAVNMTLLDCWWQIKGPNMPQCISCLPHDTTVNICFSNHVSNKSKRWMSLPYLPIQPKRLKSQISCLDTLKATRFFHALFWIVKICFFINRIWRKNLKSIHSADAPEGDPPDSSSLLRCG